MTRLALHGFLKAVVDRDSLVLGVRIFYMTLPLYITALVSFFIIRCGIFSSVAVPHLVTLFVWLIYRLSSACLCISVIMCKFVIRCKFLLSLNNAHNQALIKQHTLIIHKKVPLN